MLTDKEIKEFIKQSKISIDPYDEKCVKPSNYEIHLGTTFLLPKPDMVIDIKKGQIPDYEKVSVSENEGILLEPRQFLLGQTSEKISLDSDIGCFIDGRSTFARIGISIHQSATFVLPGQDPHIITLEIFNAGNFKVRVYPHDKIGKLIFFKTAESNEQAYKDYGRYAGQSETTGAKK